MKIEEIKNFVDIWTETLIKEGYLKQKENYMFIELLEAANKWAKDHRILKA